MAAPTEERVGIRSILADRSIRAVILVAFVMTIGIGVVLPVLPLYVRDFGVGYAGVGALVGAYGLARLLSDLGAGILVDRIGERAAGSGGFALVALFSLATGLAPSYPVAVICWAAAGIGSAVAFAALFSYLLKVVPKHRMARTLSVFYGSFNVGVVIGGFAAGFVAEHLGLASPLFVNAGLLALAALLYLLVVPQPQRAGPAEGASAEREGLAATLRRPGLVTVAVANLAYMWMIAAVFDTLVPLFGKDELAMSTAAIGVVFAVSLATELAVLYPAGSLSDRHGRKAVLVPALAALAVMTVSLGWAGSPVALGALMAVLGVASGFAGVPPGAMLADVVPERESGTGVGVFRFFGDLGFMVGPVVAGFVSSGLGFSWAFALAAVPTAVALALVARTPETMKPARAAG
jgi:MFS family permease